MKANLIGIDNKHFDAEIIRYFINVNDRYLIYSKDEKDNNYVLLYAVKIISDNGIKIGKNIADSNEWTLVTNLLRKTAAENKADTPVSIVDCNPAELYEVKIDDQKAFKIKIEDAELIAKNQKSFEIIQKNIADARVAVSPVPPEDMEYGVEEPEKEVETQQEMPSDDEADSYEKLYEEAIKLNDDLAKRIEALEKEVETLKFKINKIKELIQ